MKKIGILFRSYAKTSELLPEVEKRALKSARIACGLGRTYFCVPVEYDCGKTAGCLRELFARNSLDASVLECVGHHSAGSLNAAVNSIFTDGLTHVAIISNKAVNYLTAEAMAMANEAFMDGAKVVGFAIDELAEIVREGRIQNTFAIWNIEGLMMLDVPGFNSETGVEEIALSVRLIRKYGPCIAVLIPSSGKLDVRQSKDGEERHKEVMETKFRRQFEEAQRVGADFDFIKVGIMLGYPKGY